MNLSPLRGWPFTGLATRRGETHGLNLRPGSPYLHVTGTPGEGKEIDKENHQMMPHDPGSRKTDRPHFRTITGFGARPALKNDPRTPNNL
jgi:hypothetical protein